MCGVRSAVEGEERTCGVRSAVEGGRVYVWSEE